MIVWLVSTATPLFAQTAPIATVGLTSGWATFGEAVPQGAAVNGLRVGNLTTQTDVKNRWPDGSIRFAIVTVNVPSTGSYAIASSAAAAGSFTPSLPSAAVTLTIGGVPYTASLPAVAGSDLWLSGPLVREARSVVAPASASGAHAFLRVNFDTRVYNNGKARVDISVENVLDKALAGTVTYDVNIVVNGQPVFAKAAVQHYYLTRWRKVFETGAAPLSNVTPDLRPFNVSRAIPAFLPLVANQVSTASGANYEILKSGALDSNMPAHGGRAELAPYPDWTARYLVHKDPAQRAFVLANGDLSGSWPIHVREAEAAAKTGVGAERLVSLDQRPTVWYDSRAKDTGYDYLKGTPLPIREYGSLTPGPGQSPLIPDNAHQPSLAYVPYLLTGDRYYQEEMGFWANYGMLRTYPGDGVRTAAGILEYNEVRGYGWALRNLAEAAAFVPDASPVKDYLSQKVLNNLQWLDAYANAQDPVTNPFHVLWLGERPDGTQFIGLWEQNYLAYAIDRASKLGFAGGLAHRDAIAKFQLRLFNSSPDYPKAQGAPYLVAVGPAVASVGYDDYASYPFYKSMAQVWAGTPGNAGTAGNERPFGGYYGPEARLNLMMGIESGWAGAQAAYDYLWPSIGVEAFWGSLPDLGQRAGWALDFYPAASGSPPPPAGPTVLLDKQSLRFGATTSGGSFVAVTPGQTVRLIQSGPGTVTWTATSNRPWLTVSPASGTGQAALTIGVNYAAGVPASGSVAGAITITADGASNSPGAVSVSLTLYPNGTSTPPDGAVDTPTNNAIGITGSIGVTGWAIDDVAVSRVRILRNPVAPEPPDQLVFLGNATFVDGSRPDVAGLYPAAPMETRGGWGLLVLTNMLPALGNGTFTFYAYADDADGHSVALGSRTITCDNAHATKPFGAIDTPAQGATVSGIVNNFGWVLGQAGRRADAPGGGSVTVFIDAVPVGSPTGWVSRSDLISVFPSGQYAGVSSALAVFSFDSTALTNGMHSISWTVTDNMGNADGVGSRFFWVWNGFGAGVTAGVERQGASVAESVRASTAAGRLTVSGRAGFDPDAPWRQLDAGRDGVAVLDGEELGRVELQVGEPGAGVLTGYLRTAAGLEALPIGSAFDAAAGTFAWQPGPGFVGAYDLVFVQPGDAREVSRADVRVVVHPKGRTAAPAVVIDIPNASQVVGDAFTVAGWACDPRAAVGTGIDVVQAWAYPADGGDPVFVGDAAVGVMRPDVAAHFGDDRFRASGYGLTVQGLAPGRYMIAVFGRSTATHTYLPAATVHVTVQ